MKVFVFGALLVQTLNAQRVPIEATFNALAESDILNVPTDSASDSAATPTVDFGTLDLPTGTADVVLDPSSTPPTVTSDDLFGGGETAEPGVVFDGSEFNFPTPVSTADSTPTPITDPTGAIDPSDIIDPFATASSEPVAVASSSSEGPLPTIAVLLPLEPSTAVDPFVTASEAFVMPDFPGPPTIVPVVDGAAAAESPDLESAIAPEATDLPDLDDGPDDVPTPHLPSLIAIRPTAAITPLDAAEVTPIPLGSASDALGGEEDGPDSFPGGWTGTDVGNYDGEDYGDNYDDDDECPSYCYENDEDGDDDDDDDGEDDSLMRRFITWLRPRQNVPSSNGGFEALQWPGDKSTDDDCGGNIPTWLYELSGKTPASCGASKRDCPASCYTSSPTSTDNAEPTDAPTGKGGYSVHSWKRPHHTPKPYSASPVTDEPEPYPTPKDSTTEDYKPYTTSDVPTATDYDEDTAALTTSDSFEAEAAATSSSSTFDSTTTTTRTTFITSTKTADAAAESAVESAVESVTPISTNSDSSDTLAGVCPATCNPTDPLANKCDITTSCTTTGNGKYYCACRAGFRAGTWNVQDFTKQFKFASQPYVYTAPGVVCDKVCEDQTCTEVGLRPQCQ
jgi:hypothetical protein